MELDWSVDREEEASLVDVRVRNDGAVPRRVRIESRLDGPVLPPRRGGVPEQGWDAGGVTAVIDPGERAAFGFAALADPVDPPVEITSVEPATGEANADTSPESDSDLARAAIRDLESHRPPREAVTGEGAVGGEKGGEGGAVERDDDGGGDGKSLDSARDDETGASGSTGDATGRSERSDPPPSAAAPDDIDAWFAAVEARVERAERLTGADLATATAVVEEAGGLDAVASLDERVAADAERLKAIRDRAAALLDRAEESEVPTEALEGLA
jgi:hypothetical protein